MAGYLQSGYPISMSQINSVFDGRGLNLFAYRGTTWYTAAGGSGTFPSPTISFSDFFNKGPNPARSVSLAGVQNVLGTAFPGDFATAEFYFLNTGAVDQNTSDGGFQSNSTWTTPLTAGIGSSYWVRFTETSSAGTSTEYGSPRGVWVSIAGNPYFGISRTANGGAYRQYTVQIASDSGGSNIVATKTNVELFVDIVF